MRASAETAVELDPLAAEIEPKARGLVLAARQQANPPFFIATLAQRSPGSAVRIGPNAAERMGVGQGDRVWTLPLP